MPLGGATKCSVSAFPSPYISLAKQITAVDLGLLCSLDFGFLAEIHIPNHL